MNESDEYQALYIQLLKECSALKQEHDDFRGLAHRSLEAMTEKILFLLEDIAESEYEIDELQGELHATQQALKIIENETGISIKVMRVENLEQIEADILKLRALSPLVPEIDEIEAIKGFNEEIGMIGSVSEFLNRCRGGQ